jgi:hypothetical protein
MILCWMMKVVVYLSVVIITLCRDSRIRFTSKHLLSKQIDRGAGLTEYDTVWGHN